jgi:hypothetical protein
MRATISRIGLLLLDVGRKRGNATIPDFGMVASELSHPAITVLQYSGAHTGCLVPERVDL